MKKITELLEEIIKDCFGKDMYTHHPKSRRAQDIEVFSAGYERGWSDAQRWIDPKEELPKYTEEVEELPDIAICCLTALHRRGVDALKVIEEKIKYNENRKD
jgi:hypothetical protein